MPNNHVMVDIETMSTRNNAAILSIGAVIFDTEKITDEFYINVDLATSVEAGLHICPNTIMFWMEQSDAARSALVSEGVTLHQALKKFKTFVGVNPHIWGNGATFDPVILENAYHAIGEKAPWKYSKARCYRTLAALAPYVVKERVGAHHNALDDAKTQAMHLIKILEAKQLGLD